MNNNKMIKQQCERLTYLLDTVVEGSYVEGAISNEAAYACLTLAREYAKSLQGLDHDSGMIDFYEMNPDFIPMMFPDDSAVEKQIAHLEDTREMLGRPFPPPRHELMMMPTSAECGNPVKPNSNGR